MKNSIKLINGNTMDKIRKLPSNSIDLILTDPPYRTISGGSGPSETHNRPSGMLSKNDGRIFANNDIHISDWIHEAYRVLKDERHIYVMTNFLNLSEYMSEIESAGFQIHNLLIWKKNTATPNRWYMKNCEYIIFARKGRAKAINNCGTKTVLEFDNVRGKTHPTEKPVDLLKTLINNSSNVEDVVLDPFMGTGSCAEAALLTGRKFIGFEIDESFYEVAKSRIANI